jgi:hypothetical protein
MASRHPVYELAADWPVGETVQIAVAEEPVVAEMPDIIEPSSVEPDVEPDNAEPADTPEQQPAQRRNRRKESD